MRWRSIEESLRDGKRSLLGTLWTVLGQDQGFCRLESRLLIKAEPQECFGGVRWLIHLEATAEQFHWDLKKAAGRQSPFEITTPSKREDYLNGSGGAACWVNVKWEDGSGRQWRCFHMYNSTPFALLPFSLFLLSVFKAVIKPPQLSYLSLHFCHNEPSTQLTGASAHTSAYSRSLPCNQSQLLILAQRPSKTWTYS